MNLNRSPLFPISRDPPEGGTLFILGLDRAVFMLWFPISRDPPEGGTIMEILNITLRDD